MKYVANFRASLTNISSSSKVRSECFLPMRFCVGEQPDWVAKAAPYLFVPREGARARDTLARLAVQCFRRRRGTPMHAKFSTGGRTTRRSVAQGPLFAIIGGRKSYCTATTASFPVTKQSRQDVSCSIKSQPSVLAEKKDVRIEPY